MYWSCDDMTVSTKVSHREAYVIRSSTFQGQSKSNGKSLEILYYGKRWMLGSLIQLATQGIETQLHINPPIVSYRIGLSGYEVDLELPVLGFLGQQ